MSQYTQFISQQWLLFTLLAAVAVVYLLFEWLVKDDKSKIDPQQAINIYNKHKGILLDIRSHEEFNAGHIVGSISNPMLIKKSANLTAEDIKDLLKYKKNNIVLISNDNKLSCNTAKNLRSLGFAQVYILHNGISAWKNEGLPLIT